jgi:hypothetical protein
VKLVTILVGIAALAVTPLAFAQKKPPKQNQALTIVATPSPVVYGSTTVISGRLGGPQNGGKQVTLRSDPFPFGGFGNVATTTTAGNGRYAFPPQKPLVNTRYQTRQGPTTSVIGLVLVRKRVSLNVSDSTPASGQRVRFSGRACPTHNGLAVGIQRLTRRGFHTIRSTTLKPSTRCSVYSRTFRVFRDGVFRTVVAGDSDHARGFSRRRALNAH